MHHYYHRGTIQIKILLWAYFHFLDIYMSKYDLPLCPLTVSPHIHKKGRWVTGFRAPVFQSRTQMKEYKGVGMDE